MKKVKMLKSCKWAFSPSEPIDVFEIDKVYDLPNDKADLLIKSVNAKLFEDKSVAKNETAKEEGKTLEKKDSKKDKLSKKKINKMIDTRSKSTF
jgi:hypothetical protein